MGPSCSMPGGGSASLGWASVPWEKAPDLDCELRPAGLDAGARVRGRWVGILPQDSPLFPLPPRKSREPEQALEHAQRWPLEGAAIGSGGVAAQITPTLHPAWFGLGKGARWWGVFSLRLCRLGANRSDPLPHLEGF